MEQPSTSGKKAKTVHSRERKIVYNVYNFLKRLSFPLLRESTNFNQTGKLCAQACGISEKTVNRICKEAELSVSSGTGTNNIEPCFSTPGKERKRKCKVSDLDDFEKGVLRRIVFSFYDRGEFLSSEKITKELKEKINFKGSEPSTRSLKRLLAGCRDSARLLYTCQRCALVLLAAAQRTSLLPGTIMAKLRDTSVVTYNLVVGKVSGLVKHVPLAELDQRMVVVLCNLKPQKMRGIVSEAMVLCASTPQTVELLMPPPHAKAGDNITVPGYPRNPDLPFMNPKKKIFEKIAEDLKVNSNKQACYKDVPWEVEGKGGYITVQAMSGCYIK